MYLICGEALFDFFLTGAEGPGALRFEARAGGSPFNVAIGIARRGGRAALLTGVSEDMLGARLARLLESEGVETGYLIRSGRRTTLSLVDLSEGQPAYAFYGLGSADAAVTEADLPALGPEISGLHFGSYSIATPPVADAFAALAARERARFVSLDPNVRPTVEPDMAVWRRRIAALAPHVDLLKVSAEDLGLLFPGEAPAAIARRWLAEGPRLVVVTDGGRAARAYRSSKTVSETVEVAPPPCAVVDTVGAGDAFQAALLAGLAERGDPLTALAALDREAVAALLGRAARLAAATCARRGADIPRLAELPDQASPPGAASSSTTTHS